MGAALRNAEWLVRRLAGEAVPGPRLRDLAALAELLRGRRLAAGQVLYRPGTVPEGVWILRSGVVELSVGSGRRRSIVQRLHEGEIVGDVYLILDSSSPVEARVVEDCRCLFLSADHFTGLLETNPRIAALWLRSACMRIARSRSRIISVLGSGAAGRVPRLLLQEAAGDDVRMSQEAMAQMLGIRRPAVNRALKELERDGLVEVGYGRVRLLEREALERLAEEG